MNKELRPGHEEVVCDVCGRTMLKGERAEPYLAPGGQRMLVCELCTDRAYASGWIRESAHAELPTGGRRHEPRRSLRARVRRRLERPPVQEPGSDGDRTDGRLADAGVAVEPDTAVEPDGGPADWHATRPKDPRHVRAVPTNAQAKTERAIDVFNESEYPRAILGIARSLGEPWVSATPSATAPSEISIVVAWELSWYHYLVDLADENEPVTLAAKGEELEELEDWAREWNASALADGRLALGVGSRG